LELFQRDAARVVEGDPFRFEKKALQMIGAGLGPQTDPASGVDDALPRQIRFGRQRVQRVSHLPGATWKTGHVSDLPVGRYASAGYTAHCGVDARVVSVHGISPKGKFETADER
jgi:hypothetical protein